MRTVIYVLLPEGRISTWFCRLECGHVFCKGCLVDWFESGHFECPSCRTETRNPPYRIITLKKLVEALAGPVPAEIDTAGDNEDAWKRYWREE